MRASPRPPMWFSRNRERRTNHDKIRTVGMEKQSRSWQGKREIIYIFLFSLCMYVCMYVHQWYR
jgi:hypothetical protein